MFLTLYIVLCVSKNTVLVIFQNITFRRLDSISVFRENLLSRAKSIELVPISGPETNGDRIQSPKRCVLKNKQDGVFR
jgi:hypothetical protein